MKVWILLNRPLFLIWLLLLFLSACSRDNGADSTSTPTVEPTASPTVQAVATATSRPTATPEPTPEPIIPSISVAEQPLDEDGQLTIDLVVAPGAGWLVIYSDDEGEPGAILGYSAVVEGENEDVGVTVEPLQATELLHAGLHADGGEPAAFEFPGPDSPIRFESEAVTASFEVELQAIVPALEVSDQEIGEDGLVTVDRAIMAEPGWLALHVDEDGQPGEMLNFVPVMRGENRNVTIPVNWREATTVLYAVLYQDTGQSGQFEHPDSDPQVVVNDEPVAAAFNVILPLDVFVLDQPVIDGTVVVERVSSNENGWLAVYSDADGALANIIGFAPISSGINHQVVISVTESAVTPQLHLMVHQDAEPLGEFGFPVSDPLAMYQDQIPNPVTFQTDSGNYVISRDQELSGTNTIVVPFVVVDTDSWAVVRNDSEGEPNEIIGMTWVPAGLNRDIVVDIDPELATNTLHVILHLDAARPQEFDYPDGIDIPLQRSRNVIRAPFMLLVGEETNE